MLSICFLVTLISLITSVSATGILLPLYVYPSAKWNDGAANWKPVFQAAKAYPTIDWIVVINPHNGPGLTGQPGDNDINVKSGVSQLNAFNNVKTIGYVHTGYAKVPMKELQANITKWANWSSYKGLDLSINGLFFDESNNNFSYLNESIAFARKTFRKPITIACNFGVKTSDQFYSICDIVVGFESCLNCRDGPQYKGQTTLDSNFVIKYRSRSAVILNRFTGRDYKGEAASASLLTSYVKNLVKNGIGWFYFGSADYNDITAAPATVGQNANSLASARS